MPEVRAVLAERAAQVPAAVLPLVGTAATEPRVTEPVRAVRRFRAAPVPGVSLDWVAFAAPRIWARASFPFAVGLPVPDEPWTASTPFSGLQFA